MCLCEEIIVAKKSNLNNVELDEREYFINIGYAQYFTAITAKELFSKADFALTASKAKGAFHIMRFDENEQGHVILGKEAWAQELRSAMDEKRFKLAYQNAVNSDDYTDVFHSELFLRLQDYNGYLHNAGHFMPMVMELKMGALMDHYVIDQAIHVLQTNTFTCKGLCINLGKDIFLQSNSWAWLEDSVTKFKKIGNQKLYFEVQISFIPSEILIKFSKYLRSFGYGLGLDNFTINSENLMLMQLINPSYIKVQASSLLDLLGDNALEMPTRSLGIITDSMDIKIIAANVEDEEQKEQLKNLGINYIQGSLVARPEIIG
jgi:EAL domain-containing protein (putative c-di-GMP-specific phosphodiesterase class I)